jgi:hypothetical protein
VLAPGDVFGVRVAALAADGLDRLRCERAWALAGELIEESAWLSAEGEALSGVLHELIGRETRPGLKSLLVGLRRAVYAGRRPDRSEHVLADLPPETAARIEAWLRRLEQREELRRRLPGVLAGDLADAAGALRELAADPGFRSGLAHSSRPLSAELDKWIADPASVPRRQVLARLARYVARAMTKTSPYATFTISGLGRWSDMDPAVMTPHGLGSRVIVPEFDLRTVWRLWHAISARPDVRDAVTVRVNPALAEHDGCLRFLAAGPGEALSSVPATAAVRDVLARVTGGPDPELGAVRRAAASAALVDQMTEIGLLEVCRPFADQAGDPLGDLLAWTERALPSGSADRPWLPAGLRALHQRVTALSRQVPDARRLAAIGELTDGLLARLGQEAGPAGARPVCLGTAVATGNLAVCGRPAWQPVLNDLQVLRQFLGILDSDLPAKLTAANLFTSTYGPRETVAFLDFYRLAHTGPGALRALLNNEPGTGASTPRLRELRELRWQAGEALTGAADPGLVLKLVRSWPGYIRPPGSICCYGQALPGPGLVLNTVYSGYGRHTGRVRYLLGRAGATTPPVALYPVTGTSGSFGTGLNSRPPAATVSIDYPFTVAPGGLRLTQLRVRLDERTSRLVLLDPAGRRLLPAHLGMSSELLLPPAWSFLIRVFGEPPVALPPWWPPLRPGDAGGQISDAGAGPVRHQPRRTLGSVVVTRARWQMSAAEFPSPAKGESDASYLLGVAAWLRRHEVPSRFFARVIPARGRHQTGQHQPGKSRKPLYVDAASHFLLTSFARALSDPGDTVLLEEVLPGPADAPGYGADGQRVTEYVFDICGDLA